MHVPIESTWNVCVLCVCLLEDSLLCSLLSIVLESWARPQVLMQTSLLCFWLLPFCFQAEFADPLAWALGSFLGLALSVKNPVAQPGKTPELEVVPRSGGQVLTMKLPMPGCACFSGPSVHSAGDWRKDAVLGTAAEARLPSLLCGLASGYSTSSLHCHQACELGLRQHLLQSQSLLHSLRPGSICPCGGRGVGEARCCSASAPGAEKAYSVPGRCKAI